MADVFDKIKFLKFVRLNPELFLPMTDHAWKVFPAEDRGEDGYDDPEYNLGWDAGLLDGNRPYFMECWATSGITMLTYFFSTKGLENAEEADLLKLLTDHELFRPLDPENPRMQVMKFEDDDGNVFFSVNVTVGVEDETFIDGGIMYPYKPLNEYNSRMKREEEKQK